MMTYGMTNELKWVHMKEFKINMLPTGHPIKSKNLKTINTKI